LCPTGRKTPICAPREQQLHAGCRQRGTGAAGRAKVRVAGCCRRVGCACKHPCVRALCTRPTTPTYPLLHMSYSCLPRRASCLPRLRCFRDRAPHRAWPPTEPTLIWYACCRSPKAAANASAFVARRSGGATSMSSGCRATRLEKRVGCRPRVAAVWRTCAHVV